MTAKTRTVLLERLRTETPDAPRFFSKAELETLTAFAGVLLPRLPRPTPSEAAFMVDTRLANNSGNGWRYDDLPPDGEMYRELLAGLDKAANGAFATAPPATQKNVVGSLKDGTITGERFQTMNPKRVYEEVLSELVECFASFPSVWDEMGYDGYADAHGFAQVGLNAPLPDPGTRPLPVVADNAPPSTPQIPPPAKTCDIVIIGTGAGGAPLLARFAQAGLSVIALEAGQRFQTTDFATDERAQSDKIFWNSERLSAGGDPVAFGNNNSGSGVGGSTLHYTAYTPRPHPDDFRLHTENGVGADWRLSYDDLEPYLTEAEQFLGVSGVSDYPWGGRRSKSYPLAPLPLNSAAQLMERGCASLGIRTAPAANAALSGRYYQDGVGWREACTNRGFCQAGCSVGAKASMDITYIRLSEQHGAKVYPDCFATQIERDKTGRVTGVVYIHDGQTHRISCNRAVFLCAGAIESPRLLLLNDLGNESGQVGRNFMAHPGLQLWAQFDEITRPNRGIPGGLISEDTHRPLAANADLLKDGVNFVGGYLLQSIGVMPVTYASQLSRGVGLFGDDLLDHLRGYNHVAGINILGEGLPYPGNFMELSEEKDERGLPKPRIHYTAGTNEMDITAHANKVMRAIFAEAGATENIWSYQRFAHTLGTCRMGTNPETSVVNPDCRVHSSPNLYICDNSIFPSSLAVNPALTQIALSLRTADRFLAISKQGDA